MIDGPIRRYPREHVDRRDGTRLPFAWIRAGDPPARAEPNGRWLTRGAPAPTRTVSGPILVMLGSDPPAARAEFLAHAAFGARVYALVGPSWGDDQPEAGALQATTKVLVRRVPEVPASLVHSATGTQVWLGGGFVLRLDDAQAEAARQTFLRLFWHEATEEAWSTGRALAWRPVRERPFDVPELPAAAAVRWANPDARLAGTTRGVLLHLAGGTPPDAAPLRLWFPAGPDHQDRLAALARSGAAVVWEERGLPDLLVGDGAGEALLPGVRGRLRLRLTAGQSSEIGRLLERSGDWRFQTDVAIGEAALRKSSFWLPDAPSDCPLETEAVIPLGDVAAASLRAVAETVPEAFPPAQPLALAVRYTWSVVPPGLPRGAVEDALVVGWRQLDEAWTKRLVEVREALKAADGDRGRIGSAFSRLMSAMLGFEHAHAGMQKRVDELERQRPSTAGPAGARDLLDRLDKIEAEASTLRGDLAETERKAREDQEREKQEAGWRTRVDDANGALSRRRQELGKAEETKKSNDETLRANEQESKTVDKEKQKDLEVIQRRLGDEQRRIARQLQQLHADIKGLEKQAAEKFEFRPPPAAKARPAPTGGRFVPPAPSARKADPVPAEALPEVGALCSKQDGQHRRRYLVIERWEDLAAGEQAAARLHAELVAPEES